MPIAYNLLRPQIWYRQQAFTSGLRAAGYDVVEGRFGPGKHGDVAVIWNRYGGRHVEAERFEKNGGTVIVAENGIIGEGGSEPKFDVYPGGGERRHYYSLALDYHNGRGRWTSGGPERWQALGIEVKPRREGGHVLVCPNRSFGVPPQVMDSAWADRAALRLSKQTQREVRIRRHPGNNAPKRPLAADLKGAHAVVVWSSNAAVHAIVEGIPTYIEAPFQWVKGAGASGPVDAPVVPDPMPHLVRAAWAQWRLEEIETGEPFRHLLSAAGQGALAAGS